MFLVRVQLPDTPGSLGAVATAIGTLGGDIEAIEIVERGPDYAIDHFLLELPAGTPTDAIVSVASEIEGVTVLWVSRYPTGWGIESDIETLERMAADPSHALTILTASAPIMFHCQWAIVLSPDASVLTRSDLGPTEVPTAVGSALIVSEAARGELARDWLPGWGETTFAAAPLPGGGTIVLGRSGGPGFLDSELNRLRHLSALAH